MKQLLIDLVTPNRMLSKRVLAILVVGLVVAGVVIWITQASPILPRPWEVLQAFVKLWTTKEFARELMVSMNLNIEAIAIATLISLGLAYATVLDAMKPIAGFASLLRFSSMAGLTLIFTLMSRGSHELKLYLLTFNFTVFLVTSMIDVVAKVDSLDYDHAYTLRLGRWRAVWEVVVYGRLSNTIDMLRQNAAIGWMMLTSIEGLARSEGGIGGMLLNQDKHFHYDTLYAIQLSILLVGLTMDYGFGLLKRFACPHTRFTQGGR